MNHWATNHWAENHWHATHWISSDVVIVSAGQVFCLHAFDGKSVNMKAFDGKSINLNAVNENCND